MLGKKGKEMEKKNKLKTHLDKAYQYISKLQVSGDAVDLVALARAELRAAWQEIENTETEGDADETDDASVQQWDSENAAGTV